MIAELFKQAIDDILSKRLENRNQKNLVVTTLMLGFADLRKKPVPDLDKRLKRMESRFKILAEDVSVGFLNDRVVIKITGASESLMTELRRGTDWYVPWNEIDEIVLAAVLTDPIKN